MYKVQMSPDPKTPFYAKSPLLVVVVHVESGLQGLAQLCLREDDVAGQTANTTGTVADGHLVGTRHATAVGTDAACVAHSVAVLELLGRREFKTCKGTRFAQQVTSMKS